jgi:endoglucanase
MYPTPPHNGSRSTTRNRSLTKRWMFLIVLASTLALAAQDRTAAGPPDASAQNQRLGRGVNIIGYDPLWKSPANARFQDRHFRLIKAAV